jgi:hypothetical protein
MDNPILIEFNIGEFYEKLYKHFIFNLDWTILTTTYILFKLISNSCEMIFSAYLDKHENTSHKLILPYFDKYVLQNF